MTGVPQKKFVTNTSKAEKTQIKYYTFLKTDLTGMTCKPLRCRTEGDRMGHCGTDSRGNAILSS